MKEHRFELHKLTPQYDSEIRGGHCMLSDITNVTLLVTYYNNRIGYAETTLSLELPDGKEYCSGERVTIRFHTADTKSARSRRIQVNDILRPLMDKFYTVNHKRFPNMIWPGSITIALNDYIDQFCEWLIQEVFCVDEKENEVTKTVKKESRVEAKGVKGFVLVWGDTAGDMYDENAKFFQTREQVLDYVEENDHVWEFEELYQPFVIDLSSMTQHPLIKPKVTF